MKNNLGFGKFEALTVFVLIIAAIAFFLHSMLGGVSTKELSKFKSNAVSFNKAVYTNIDSYRDTNMVYLEEVIDHRYMDKLKSPFSAEYCDYSESKVETVRLSERYVTLKCDNYLIYHEKASDFKEVTIYEVSDWSLEKPDGDNVDEAILYNCQNADGSLLLPTYREEGYFLYEYYKQFGKSFWTADTIPSDNCTVVSSTFYRTRKEIAKK